MKNSERALLAGLMLLLATAVCAQEKIVISAPGPRNISYLPVDLIPKLGYDRDEGVTLQLLHTGGGAVALNNLTTKNADFAVAGLPAAMSLRANGGDVVCIAAVDKAPLFVLMVRASLKNKVKRIADLKGMVIGVNASTKNSQTTSQQLAELLLKSDGVALDQVRIVPAGQSWEEQSSLMLSGAADAIVGDEPFASRLQSMGKVFFLAHLAQPDSVKKIPGTHFLHAALITRGDVIAQSPDKVAKMGNMLRKTLQWIAAHSAQELLDKLEVHDAEERASLLISLQKYRQAFSRDGALSRQQLQDTEIFFAASSTGNAAAQDFQLEQMVNDTWVGRTK